MKVVIKKDAAERLQQVIDEVFIGSPMALAKAAGVSRSLIYLWPPDQVELMDQKLRNAIAAEISKLVARIDFLNDFRTAYDEFSAQALARTNPPKK